MIMLPPAWRRRAEQILEWPGNPWHPLSFKEGQMAELHRLADRHVFFERFARFSWVVKLCLTMFWPVRLLVHAQTYLRRFGKEVAAHQGYSRLQQFGTLLYLGFGFGLPPKAYYQYRFFKPENRARLADYLYPADVSGLFPYLNRFVQDPHVNDKRLFGERCAEAGLPSVPSLAWGETGQPKHIRDKWPPGDLISKPSQGYRGRGVLFWRHTDSGYCTDKVEYGLARELLPERLDEIYAGSPWLLQPALVNHPLIADLSTGALISIRVMTAHIRPDDCRCFAAILKMPFNHRTTSNVGLGSAIHLHSGELGRAFRYRPLHQGYSHHPDTGALIEGRVLPFWDNIRQLAISAHRHFPETRLLGWDIALPPDGPILLETNSGWDVEMPQIALQGPLGNTDLPEICRQILLTMDQSPSRKHPR